MKIHLNFIFMDEQLTIEVDSLLLSYTVKDQCPQGPFTEKTLFVQTEDPSFDLHLYYRFIRFQKHF